MDNELEKDFHFWSLMKFTFPSIFTFVFIAIYQMVDGIFIERYVGEVAVGAVNLYYPVIGLFAAIGVMYGTGGNAVIVRKIGAKDQDGADKSFTWTLVVILITGIILTIISEVFAEPIMRMCGASDINIVYLRPYYYVLCAGAAAIMLQSVLGIFLIGEGQSVLTAVVIMVGGVLNCVLDYVFMNCMDMGIMGAAIATLIGYLSTIVLGVWFYIIKKKSVYSFKTSTFNLREMAVICLNGMSDMVSQLAAGVTALVMNHLVYQFKGELGVSALSVVLYFQFFVMAVFMGFTSAVEPVFSFYYGSGNTMMRKRVFKLSMIWTAVISILIIACMFIFNEQIVGLFFDNNTEIFGVTKYGFLISLIACIFVGFNVFISGLFTAFSNGVVSGGLSIFRTLVVLIIFLFLFSKIWGETGMWAAWPAAELVSLILSCVLVILFRKKYKY